MICHIAHKHDFLHLENKFKRQRKQKKNMLMSNVHLLEID